MRRRDGVLAGAAAVVAPWSAAVPAQADPLEGLWMSDEGLPGGSWRWTLRKDGAAWHGDVERQAGALTPRRWRLRGRLKDGALQAVLEQEAGGPTVQVQARRVDAERLALELRWPDGLVERFELTRP
jgi:hypothetical protein